jgi:hypothetical protein
MPKQAPIRNTAVLRPGQQVLFDFMEKNLKENTLK